MCLQRQGKIFYKIDRWFPSSKQCCRCGSIKKDLSLSDRIYKCNSCDMEIDRDYGTSINILREGLRNLYGENKKLWKRIDSAINSLIPKN